MIRSNYSEPTLFFKPTKIYIKKRYKKNLHQINKKYKPENKKHANFRRKTTRAKRKPPGISTRLAHIILLIPQHTHSLITFRHQVHYTTNPFDRNSILISSSRSGERVGTPSSGYANPNDLYL